MKNNIVPKIVAIILVIASMLAVASCSENDELKPKPAITTQSDSIAEETPILAEIEYKNKFYRIVAENINSTNIGNLAYAIYDMDDNGIPELIIDNGYKTNTMENGVEFYSYSETDGISFIGSSYDGWANTFYDEEPGDGKINIVFTGKEKIQVNEYSISNNELTVTTVVELRDITDDDRLWIDSLKGKIEFVYYESETSATEFITEEQTTSLYEYYNS